MTQGVDAEGLQSGACLGVQERIRRRAGQIGFVHSTAAEVPLGMENRFKQNQFQFAGRPNFAGERGAERGEDGLFPGIGAVDLA